MSPTKIKAELTKRGYTTTLVAQALYKSPSLISKVVSKKAKSRSVAEAIAKLIDVPFEEAFPELCEVSRIKENERKQEQLLSEIRAKLES